MKQHRPSTPDVLIVGGSIGGLSAAHALQQAGCKVRVLERAAVVSSPTGAGIGLDSVSMSVLQELGLGPQSTAVSWPLQLEAYRRVDPVQHQPRSAVILVENWHHDHRSMLWSDLHKLLKSSLPQDALHFGHEVCQIMQNSTGVNVVACTRQADGSPVEKNFACDYVIAADGVNSFVRRQLLPTDRKRYSGMIAWRGVVDGNSHPKLLQQLQADFRHLGNAIIFDIGNNCMNLIYLLPGNLINWLWYRDAAEPDMTGQSVTIQVNQQDIAQLHADADATWTPAFSALIKATEKPFINVIYDKDPIQQWIYGHVALIGEAAHCTTPHGSRSTNMSIQDAGALKQCFLQHSCDAAAALAAFQAIRLPATSEEVLFSRHVGELRQGRWVDPTAFSWPDASLEAKSLLLNAKRAVPGYKLHAEEILQRLGREQPMFAGLVSALA